MITQKAKKLILENRLPENTTIEGNLDLRNCTNLQSLPENLSVGGYLYCDDELIEKINPTKYKHIEFKNQELFNERLKKYKLQSLKGNKYKFISRTLSKTSSKTS